MPAGRPKTKTATELEKLFLIYRDQIHNDCNIVPPKSAICSTLCEKTGKVVNEKNSKAIYTAALRWCSTLKAKSEDDENDPQCDISIETSLEATKSSDETSFPLEDDNAQKKDVKKIKIRIGSNVWRTIEPTEIECARNRKGPHKSGVRKYLTLKPGLWTNVFANEIAKHDDIPCKWIFKRNKCYLSGKIYVKVEGKCTVCHAALVATLKNKPENDEPANISVEICGINLQRHKTVSKNVKLTTEVAKNIFSQKKTATSIRRNMLKTSTKMFQQPTGRIPSANAIRCGKYRQRKMERISSDPFDSLKYMQASNLYMNCIYRLGWNPFFVYYSTPEQMKLYQEYKKRNKITKISCDATGGVVHKLSIFF